MNKISPCRKDRLCALEGLYFANNLSVLYRIYGSILQIGQSEYVSPSTREQIDAIHQAYRFIYQSGLNTTMALARIKEEMEMTPEIEYIVSFVEGAKRGIIKYED